MKSTCTLLFTWKEGGATSITNRREGRVVNMWHDAWWIKLESDLHTLVAVISAWLQEAVDNSQQCWEGCHQCMPAGAGSPPGHPSSSSWAEIIRIMIMTWFLDEPIICLYCIS